MSKATRVPDHRDTTLNKLSPQKLYATCEDEEKRIEATPYRERLYPIREAGLFSHPLFETAPLGGWKPFEELAKDRYPFNFSIAPPVRLRVSEREWRYRKLLEHLEKLQDTDLRQLVIARWLKQEGVCDPKQFLPQAMLRRLVKRFHKYFPISPTALSYGKIVHNWRPYFERLRAELRARKNLQRAWEEVAKLGFDTKAIGCVGRTQSNIEAICQWLANRKNMDARTLRNAYSRIYGHRRQPNGSDDLI